MDYTCRHCGSNLDKGDIYEHFLKQYQEWLNQNGCLLCCSYKLNYVPTLEYRGTRIIHVDNIHIHLSFIMEDNFSNIKCSIHPTLENIEKSMCLIPHFMYDMYSNDF